MLSATIARLQIPPENYHTVIISAGSNDHGNPKLASNLERIRARFPSSRVTWIYPFARKTAWQVYAVAHGHGDQTISMAQIGTKDGLHPRSYLAAARLLRLDSMGGRAGVTFGR